MVTGAATGIGEALVVRLQRGGWAVFAGYRHSAPGEARWHGLPGVTGVPCDVTVPQQLRSAADTVRRQTGGRLDLLVNNAGYAGNAGVIEAAVMDDYRRVFEVNFCGPMGVVQAMAPLVKAASGRIINTSSASVHMTIPMGSAYVISKSATKAMTRHLRMELAPFGVEVTNLEPGGVRTPMTELGPPASERQWASIPSRSGSVTGSTSATVQRQSAKGSPS